jgi:hypothetical protein
MPRGGVNRLIAVSLSALPAGLRYSSETLFYCFGTRFCWRLSKPQGLVRPEGLGTLIKTIRLIESRTLDLPACSLVPQPLRYRVPPLILTLKLNNAVCLVVLGHCRTNFHS